MSSVGVISASFQSLSSIPGNQFRANFEFVVGSRRYLCDSLIAAFLSPRIGRRLEVDSSVCSFSVATRDDNDDFRSFLTLGQGAPLRLSQSNIGFFASLFEELENTDLYYALLQFLDAEISPTDAMLKLQARQTLGHDMKREIAFIASHLYEFPMATLVTLDYDTFHRVISHDSIRLKSEDFLYNLIELCVAKDETAFTLLEDVRFENLSQGAIVKFAKLAASLFDRMTASIWEQVSQRLVMSGPVALSLDNRRVKLAGVNYAFAQSDALNGIIAFLTRDGGGNVHDRNVVKIIALNQTRGDAPAKEIANFQEQASRYLSDHSSGGWVGYDFKDMVLVPTYYTLQSHMCPFLQTWVVEGSVDDTTWVELDAQQESSALLHDHSIASFPIQKIVACSKIRIRQTGPTFHRGGPPDYFALSAFEVFGKLKGYKKK
jgi:hypothetical protein